MITEDVLEGGLSKAARIFTSNKRYSVEIFSIFHLNRLMRSTLNDVYLIQNSIYFILCSGNYCILRISSFPHFFKLSYRFSFHWELDSFLIYQNIYFSILSVLENKDIILNEKSVKWYFYEIIFCVWLFLCEVPPWIVEPLPSRSLGS